MKPKGYARIVVWEGASLWVLQADEGFGKADPHSHHAIQITISLGGHFELSTSKEHRADPFVGVAADAAHLFGGRGLLAFLFVEPESPAGRAIAERLFKEQQLAAIPAETFASAIERLSATFSATIGNSELVAIGKDLVRALSGSAQPRLPDPRIRKVIAYAASHLDSELTLAEVADSLNLSHSRLRHLFVEQTGLPFKTYVLWLRLRKAVQAYSEGSSLTAAAHEAGFADSAHLSRTFRRTFGLPATTLTRL